MDIGQPSSGINSVETLVAQETFVHIVISWFLFTQMKSYFATYEEFFQENLSKLHAHFEKQGLTPDLYIIDW